MFVRSNGGFFGNLKKEIQNFSGKIFKNLKIFDRNPEIFGRNPKIFGRNLKIFGRNLKIFGRIWPKIFVLLSFFSCLKPFFCA